MKRTMTWKRKKSDRCRCNQAGPRHGAGYSRRSAGYKRGKMKLEGGKFYRNARGDDLGPMEERAPGVWLDQHGGLYHPDGRMWNHVEGSTANITQPSTVEGK